ncbi:recombinase family protein [Trichlorobacter lovleyi]|uniref:Resolvase domain n=1 Tax=Trichlorobacter lovleyi (strain ATCC BAA-1151 / DSM 17278 / SZ) TaxID=398767 RepID=B3E8C7_TRIL1|nr:recombinase family protein [Trichlorobacter lovleyi]ACD95164.1 Resolvase domain [Trichlorobacter lovleyi SZ]
MAGKSIGYVRVSTSDQHTDRQLAGLELDRVFTDSASGKNTDRPQLGAMLAYVRDGDVIHVHSLDRLARNLIDLRRVVSDLVERGIAIHFHTENLVFTPDETINPMSTLLLSMLGAVAEFERSLIRERQKEGIAAAKTRGVYRGRRPSLTPDQIAEIKQLASTGVPKAKLARRYDVSRETIYQALKSAL